jgi:hypothetical protein
MLSFVGIVIVFAFAHVATRMASERESLGRRQGDRKSTPTDTTSYPSPGSGSVDGI